MWHASIAPRFASINAVLAGAWDIAERELHGVGDAQRGEWKELGNLAVHLRRRLTEKEMQVAGITDVIDVRGTPEHQQRVERMRPYLPPQMQTLPVERFP